MLVYTTGVFGVLQEYDVPRVTFPRRAQCTIALDAIDMVSGIPCF